MKKQKQNLGKPKNIKKTLLGATAIFSMATLTAVATVSCGAIKKNDNATKNTKAKQVLKKEPKKEPTNKGDKKPTKTSVTKEKVGKKTTSKGNKTIKKPSVKIELTFDNKLNIISEPSPVYVYKGKTYNDEQRAKAMLERDRSNFVSLEEDKVEQMIVYEYKGHKFQKKAEMIQAVKKDIEEVRIKLNKVPQNTRHTYGSMKAFESINGDAYIVDGKAYNTINAAVVAYMNKNIIGDGSGRTYVSKKYDSKTKQFGGDHAILGKNNKEISRVGLGDGKTYATAAQAVTRVGKYTPSDSEFTTAFLDSVSAGHVKFKSKHIDYSKAASMVTDHSHDFNMYKNELTRIMNVLVEYQKKRVEWREVIYALYARGPVKKMKSKFSFQLNAWWLAHESESHGTSIKYELENMKNGDMKYLDMLYDIVRHKTWYLRWDDGYSNGKDAKTTVSFDEIVSRNLEGLASKLREVPGKFTYKTKYEVKGKWFQTYFEALKEAKKTIAAKEMDKTFDFMQIHPERILTTEGKKQKMLTGLREAWRSTTTNDKKYSSHKTPWIGVSRFFGESLQENIKFSSVAENAMKHFKPPHKIDRNNFAQNHIYLDELISYVETLTDRDTIDFVGRQIDKYGLRNDSTNNKWGISLDSDSGKVSGWAWGNYSGTTKIELLKNIFSSYNITKLDWLDEKIKNSGKSFSFSTIIADWKRKKSVTHEYWSVNNRHFDTKAKAMVYALEELKKLKGKTNLPLVNIDGAAKAPAGAALGVNIKGIAGTGDKSGNTYKDILVDQHDNQHFGNAKTILGKNITAKEIEDAFKNASRYELPSFPHSSIQAVQYNSKKVTFTDGDSSKVVMDNRIMNITFGTIIKFKSDGSVPSDDSVVILDGENKVNIINKVIEDHTKRLNLYYYENAYYKDSDYVHAAIDTKANKKFDPKLLISLAMSKRKIEDFEVETSRGWYLIGLNGKARFMKFKAHTGVTFTYLIIRAGTTKPIDVTKASPTNIKNGDKLIIRMTKPGAKTIEKEIIVAGLHIKSKYDKTTPTHDVIGLY